MANIIDYLAEKCKNPISKDAPFNELDAVVFARFAYLPFAEIEFSDTETVASIYQKMKTLGAEKFYYDDKKLLKLMAESPRFSDLPVSDLDIKFNKKTVEQFTAVTIHLSAKKMFITFTGTDNSLNGWREDFNMAVLESVPSQKSAKKYCKFVMETYPEKSVILGGHSKGGTLAMYAALEIKKSHQSRIAQVYSFDGPGLSKKYLQKERFEKILSRINNYIPQDSIIGRLFSHAEKFTVVKSNEKHFYQHNIYSWEIDLKKLAIKRATATEASVFADDALTTWLDGLSKSQKEVAIDVIVKILETSKYDTPLNIAAAGKESLPVLFDAYKKLDKKDRKIIKFSAKKLLSSALAANKRRRRRAKKSKAKK